METKRQYNNLVSNSVDTAVVKTTALPRIISNKNAVPAYESDVPVHVRKTFYSIYGKRALDILLSLSGMLVLSPLLLTVAIITFFDVGRPIIFKQERAGKDGKKFLIYKFRNMTNDTDENGVLLSPEQRVTKIGKIMRSTSLDELPQLWNILKGDLSVIGPRPMFMDYLPLYSKRHWYRQAVRPGLECPNLKPLGHIRLYQEQFENDVWYAENLSFLTDLKLMLRLVQMVLDRKERALHASASITRFEGYDGNEAFCIINGTKVKTWKEYLKATSPDPETKE